MELRGKVAPMSVEIDSVTDILLLYTIHLGHKRLLEVRLRFVLQLATLPRLPSLGI